MRGAAALLVASLGAGCSVPVAPAGDPAADPPADGGARTMLPEAARRPITSEALLEHIAALPVDRYPGGGGHEAARTLLRERLGGWGLEPREHVFRWEGTPGTDLVNFEVRVPAEQPGAPIVIACAHYDAVPRSPGADDNGSGTAVVLELARRLGHRRLPSELRLLWFDAEERGMVGSREYVLAMDEDERRRVVGVVNLETVGYTNRDPDSQRMPPGSRALHDPGTVGDFVLVLGNLDSVSLAQFVELGMAAETGPSMRAEVFSRLPGAGWLMPDSRRSDHSSFWDAGIPAVMLTDTANFRNPNYHRRLDRVDTLDGEFLAAVARGVERALLLLTSGDDL